MTTFFTKVNATTQKGQAIIWDYEHARYADIEDAYERPSNAKRHAFNDIWFRATQTPGYNHDLRVAGRSSHQFSTVYSFTDADGRKNIVKDTRDHVYLVTLG